MFPQTRPTLFFCADRAILMKILFSYQILSFQKIEKIKKQTDKNKKKNKKKNKTKKKNNPQKQQQKKQQLKNVKIAKTMIKIIFFNFLGVQNFIICMFSGTTLQETWLEFLWCRDWLQWKSGMPRIGVGDAEIKIKEKGQQFLFN